MTEPAHADLTRLHVVIPVRSVSGGKARLGGALDAEEREALVLGMLRQTLAVVAEALALARKANVDAAKVREALLGGFAQSRVLEVHGERILARNYKPGFRAQLYAKDYRIAAETLAASATPAPITAAVHQLVTALVASGRGADDYSALAKVVFELAGIRSDAS